ncbi:FbpB family small basic protein [Bacillus sp. AK128]
MRKTKVNFMELVKKNKEELLKDKVQVEKIEKRVEQKIISFK